MTKGIYNESLLTPYIDSLKQYKVLSKEEEQEFFQRINDKEDDFIFHLASNRDYFRDALAKALEKNRGEDEESDRRFQELLESKKAIKSLYLKFCRENGKVRSSQDDLYSYFSKSEEIRKTIWFKDLDQKRLKLQVIRNEFARHNLRLVISLAKRYSNFYGSLKITDLIQEGNLGLMKAVTKFDSSREVKFSTYSSWWIKQSMRRAMHDKNKTIRLPVHISENANKIRVFSSSFLSQHGRQPTESEIAKETGFPRKLVNFILNNNDIFTTDISLDKPVGDDEGYTLIDMLAGISESAENNLQQVELSADLMAAISSLTPREAFIIRNRFEQELTLEEIGNQYNISRERVRQLESVALKKLRKHPSLKQHANSLFFS